MGPEGSELRGKTTAACYGGYSVAEAFGVEDLESGFGISHRIWRRAPADSTKCTHLRSTTCHGLATISPAVEYVHVRLWQSTRLSKHSIVSTRHHFGLLTLFPSVRFSLCLYVFSANPFTSSHHRSSCWVHLLTRCFIFMSPFYSFPVLKGAGAVSLMMLLPLVSLPSSFSYILFPFPLSSFDFWSLGRLVGGIDKR